MWFCPTRVSAQQPTRVAHIGFLGHRHGMGKHKSTRCLPVCATLAAQKGKTIAKGLAAKVITVPR
jgi:hypothetical protein